MNFYILDDDISTRKILVKIIRDESLGAVVGDHENPVLAIDEILIEKPDIVLIDLLMPMQDGIETVQQLKKQRFSGKFMMISQIENKDMVGRAYEAGIEYFIHKPINKIEVVSVITKVIERMKMEASMKMIQENLQLFPFAATVDKRHEQEPKSILEDSIRKIFVELGILGEAGSSDIADLMRLVVKNKIDFEKTALKELYMEVLKSRGLKTSNKSVKAFEQRLRRAINQALTNLASLGLTDYAHPKFEQLASRFFDFNEVRLKMNELDDRNPSRNPRINIKKFLFAFHVEIQEQI